MRFEAQLAMRHLKSGGGQTLLTVGAVASAVTVIIFITSLIRGLQQHIIDDFIGSIAHVTVKMPERETRPLADALQPPTTDGRLLTSRIEKQGRQRKNIENWVALETELARFPHVQTVAAGVRGQAFLIRGEKRFGVGVTGADPARQENISRLQADMVDGEWLGIGPDDIVIGAKLGKDAGIGLGDRVRLQSTEGITTTFRIAGIYDTGQDQIDVSSIYMTLHAAQSLFAMKRAVSVIALKLDGAFQANAVADQIAAALPYETVSWMREIPSLMDAFRAQGAVSSMISAFALLASTFSIASVLIVSVIQKSKQIGILKSMGARSRQILLIFTLEGLGIAVIGAIVGAVAGYGLLMALLQVKYTVRAGKEENLFPVVLDAKVFAIAMLAAIIATVIAALLPARRAARLNPVEVIRGG